MSSTPTPPSGSNLYSQGYGTTPSASLSSAVKATRDPATTDVRGVVGFYPIGQRWVNTSGNNVWTLSSLSTSLGITSATWVQDSAGTGSLNELDGDSGTALPSTGAITIAGGTGITTSASGSTVTVSLSGAGVAIDSFVPDAGTNPVVPTAAGAVTMAGTANQITTTGGLNSLTFSVPTTFIAPGSMESTTSTTVGNALTVTTGGVLVSGGNIINSHSTAGIDVNIQATNSNNSNAASRAGVEIATGGAASGDPYLTFQISGVAASTMSMGLDNSASDLFVVSNNTDLGTSNALTLTQAGALNATTSITAGTTLTATLGAITATNGNLVLNTAGNKIISTSVATDGTAGANSFGSATLSGGTVTINTTAVTASSLIFIWRQSVGATGAAATGNLTVGAIVAATSFIINSVQAADATALQASDVSVVGWMIVN